MESSDVSKTFHPPGLASLTEIDRLSNTIYRDQIVTIQGLVSPSSQGGWPGDKNVYNVQTFTFAAWRVDDGPLKNEDLTVLRAVTPEASNWDEFTAYTQHRLQVFISNDESRAILVNKLVTEKDYSLHLAAERLNQPVVIHSQLFGNLVLDRRYDHFESETEWSGQPVRLSLPNLKNAPTEDSLATVAVLWADQAHWHQTIMEFIVDKLLEVKNDYWLDDDEPVLTREDFLSRIQLDAISISSDDSFTFWFSDGDLFYGHAIEVRGDLIRGLFDAGIAG